MSSWDEHIDCVRVSDCRFTRVIVPLDFNRNVDLEFERVTYNGLPVTS